MERSRSKRSYHYDHDSDSQTPPPPRSKPRYDAGRRQPHHHHRHRSADRGPPSPPPPSSASSGPGGGNATTFFQILCPDLKVGSIIGKNGSIITNFRRETGAWINVHPLVPGDEERIIETSDSRRREPDGRPPVYSPAQEALLMVHERILDSDLGEVDREDGWRGGGGGGGRGEREGMKVTTRLVVPRLHVGCLLGKGGKIIEQMRMETRTHIRILPRDDYTPRCVSVAEEIVQIMGEGNCVKKAVTIISARLKESLHRDRGPFRRVHTQDDFFTPDDEFNSGSHHQPAMEGLESELRSSLGQSRARNGAYNSHPSEYTFDPDADPMNEKQQLMPYEELVFRILCPNNKVENIMGASDGIIEMLRGDVGVDVRVNDPVPGSSESVIIISSEEGPNDYLFPAQEALLHIQTHIVDLGPDMDNIITTRLLIPASEIGCLEERDGSLSDIQKATNANVQILPKEDLPPCALEADELIQIVGEIRAARTALVQVTAKLRSYLYRDISNPKDMQVSSISAPSHVNIYGTEPSSVKSSPREAYHCNDPPSAVGQNIHSAPLTWQPKDNGDSSSASHEQKESNGKDEGRQSAIKRFNAPLVTKSTLEVIIPKTAVQSLLMRSGIKLAQISEMSGATVRLIEDRPEQTEKIVQISGTPDQSERAQSLLQGFILSTLDDFPSS